MARKRRLKELEKKLAGLVKSVSRLERRIRTTTHRVADVPAKHARSTNATSTVKKPAVKRTTGRRATTDTKATGKRASHSRGGALRGRLPRLAAGETSPKGTHQPLVGIAATCRYDLTYRRLGLWFGVGLRLWFRSRVGRSHRREWNVHSHRSLLGYAEPNQSVQSHPPLEPLPSRSRPTVRRHPAIVAPFSTRRINWGLR